MSQVYNFINISHCTREKKKPKIYFCAIYLATRQRSNFRKIRRPSGKRDTDSDGMDIKVSMAHFGEKTPLRRLQNPQWTLISESTSSCPTPWTSILL